jgi:hypothetical protein
MNAIALLRDSVLLRNEPVMIYFDQVASLEPAALLLLIAEIYRCRNLRPSRGGRIVNGNYPTQKDVFLQLREMGFYRLIEVDERLSIPDGEQKKDRPYFIPFATHKGVNPEFAATFCELASTGAFPMNEVALGRMVGALKEAMGNAEEHAYALPEHFSLTYPIMSGRWWVTGYVDPTNHEMMITFFDQGVGIPNKLEAELFDIVRSALSTKTWSPSDGYMIAAATELYRTSTGLSGRGKGFRDMKKFVDTCDDGELWVLSNRGSYRYVRDKEHIADNTASIVGTLIEWRVRHSAAIEVE